MFINKVFNTLFQLTCFIIYFCFS